MKRIATLLLAAGAALQTGAQVVLSEDFNSPFTLSASGWTVQNNSIPLGPNDWFQGNPNVFSAYNGNAADYVGANYANTSTTTAGDISTWLISPSVTIYNGAVVEFATRTVASATVFADRLQLRMSQTSPYTLPTGTASVGSFTDLLLDINPNLTVNNSSVVSNGTVNGYPQAWTVFSVQISGVTGTVTGRFAFRYFVQNGGFGGTNSDYIGVDAFRYTLPCGPTVQSYSICSGGSATLNAIGGLPATTYLWSTTQTTQSITVTPASTTVYSLFPSVGGSVQCGNAVTATVTVGSALSVSATASAYTVCAGRTVTLSANAQASNFAWGIQGGSAPIATTPVTTVAPTSTTTYTVGALNGLCTGSTSLVINTLPNPTLSYAASPTVACPGKTVTLTGSGASTYTWVLGTQATTANPVSVTTSTNPAGGTFTMILFGTGSNGCAVGGVLTITTAAQPTVTASISKTVECINKTVTVSAGGASTYTWSGASTSNAQSFTFNVGGTATTHSFGVAGTSSDGCTAGNTAVVSISVSACAGISEIDESQQASVYPNPFVNELRIFDLNGSIEVYNSIGQLVIRENVSGSKTIDTSNLPKGAYIMKAFNNKGEVIKHAALIRN